MSGSRLVTIAKQTGKHTVHEDEGPGTSTYTAQFTDLELRLDKWQLEIRGRVVFTRKLWNEWFSRRFETHRVNLIAGDGTLTYGHRGTVRNLCLNAGFLPNDAMLERVFRSAEMQLTEISRGARTHLQSHLSVVKTA